MRVREMFPSDCLCAEDLKGKDVSLTISEVKGESLMNLKTSKKEPKFTVYFAETDKKHETKKSPFRMKLVLNKTNAKAIAKLHGQEALEWVGKRITLYPTTCAAFGDPNTPCIRVRDKVPS